MLLIDRSARLSFFTLIVVVGTYGQITFAEISGLGEDGWHTWQVRAVDSLPAMCCFTWRYGSETEKQCNLDGKNRGFGTSGDFTIPGDALQVFAFMDAGVASSIRVLSSSCPVSASSAITDLGPVDTEDSVEWLAQFIASDNRSGSDAIAAIAVHEGRKARDVLVETSKTGNDDDRENAIFWMGQVRVGETGGALKGLVADDPSADIRKHAAFSYAQSGATDVAEVLIQQGRNDADPDVRSQAWFWLAQTEAAESEVAIGHALLNDKDEDVREEAVFALSQLPKDRAVKALTSILEDRQLTREIREQALFWLVQTESDEAFETIDRLLGDN